MSKLKYDWDSPNVVTDVRYNEEEAAAFEQLLSQQQTQESTDPLASLVAGSLLSGRIVELTKDFVVVDVGLKSEGLIDISEFTDPAELFLDNIVEVFLDQTEGDNGQIVLSRDKARRVRQWEHLVENCNEGSIVTGKVLRKVKGGLIVDIGGVDAFLPASQIGGSPTDLKRLKYTDELLGKVLEFKILKINEDRKNIIVSRRGFLEDERTSKKIEMLEHFHEGEIRTGVVKNITDFGVFLDVGGVDALLHITDMAWKRVGHPSEMVNIGDSLEIVILHVNRDNGRVAVGIKQKEENPWEAVEKKYPPGTIIRGRVTSLVHYGAFVEIEPGIEGLVHVSEMSWTKSVEDPSQVVKEGDIVQAAVIAVQKDEGRVSLSMKQLEKDPWVGVEEKYPVGSNLKVEIKTFTNFGAVAEIEPRIDGFIHNSDICWVKKVSHPSEVLKKGDMLETVVLSIDRDNRRINLGVKQLASNPWENVDKTMPVGSTVKGTVSKIMGFGAFVTLDNGLEGLIHVSELSDKPLFGNIKEIIAEGQNITAKVIKIDQEHKKVFLSIKELLIEKNKENLDDIVVGEKKKRATKKKTQEVAE